MSFENTWHSSSVNLHDTSLSEMTFDHQLTDEELSVRVGEKSLQGRTRLGLARLWMPVDSCPSLCSPLLSHTLMVTGHRVRSLLPCVCTPSFPRCLPHLAQSSPHLIPFQNSPLVSHFLLSCRCLGNVLSASHVDLPLVLCVPWMNFHVLPLQPSRLHTVTLHITRVRCTCVHLPHKTVSSLRDEGRAWAPGLLRSVTVWEHKCRRAGWRRGCIKDRLVESSLLTDFHT